MKRWAIYSFVLANALDIYTSMFPEGFEGNPWMRDAAMHPVLSHALAIKATYFVMYGALLLIGYLQLKKLSQLLADLMVVGVCLYGSLQFVDTIIGNYVIHLKWMH
jgi:hypothetical protein